MPLFDEILRLFGTNRTRLRWKWERLKLKLAAEKNRAENRARAVTYQHKACPACGHPADRAARRCTSCGARLPSALGAKLGKLGHVLFGEGGGFAATSILVVLNVGIYFLMVKPLGTLGPNNGQLLRWGAWVTVPPLTYDWPRWLTSCFLHGGLLHLAFNMIALVQLGPVLEGIFGRRRFELIYFGAGFAGMATSVLWRAANHEVGVGVGASGAIFGLIGAASAYGLRRGGRIAADFRRQFLTWALYAFLLGFVLRADNWAHGGGFVGGAIIGFLLGERSAGRGAPGWVWSLVELGLFGLLVYSGWHVWAESRG